MSHKSHVCEPSSKDGGGSADHFDTPVDMWSLFSGDTWADTMLGATVSSYLGYLS